MKALLLAIFVLSIQQSWSQFTLSIKVEDDQLLVGDHLAIKGFVVSRDTTIVSAVRLLDSDIDIDVPVYPGNVSYKLEIIHSRGDLDLALSYAGKYEASADTLIKFSSPADEVAPSHVIEMPGINADLNTFLPGNYDAKKSLPHILFVTWKNKLLKHENAWWTGILEERQAIVTRVNIASNIDTISLNDISSFIADTVSHSIRRKFSLLPGRENFIITGEGFGATIALSAILDHEGTFGRSGIFLPSFNNLTEEAMDKVKKHASNANGMFFFYNGAQPDVEDRKFTSRIMDALGAGSRSLIYVVHDEVRSDNTGDWKKWFPEFYRWVFSNGLNYIIR